MITFAVGYVGCYVTFPVPAIHLPHVASVGPVDCTIPGFDLQPRLPFTLHGWLCRLPDLVGLIPRCASHRFHLLPFGPTHGSLPLRSPPHADGYTRWFITVVADLVICSYRLIYDYTVGLRYVVTLIYCGVLTVCLRTFLLVMQLFVTDVAGWLLFDLLVPTLLMTLPRLHWPIARLIVVRLRSYRVYFDLLPDPAPYIARTPRRRFTLRLITVGVAQPTPLPVGPTRLITLVVRYCPVDCPATVVR